MNHQKLERMLEELSSRRSSCVEPTDIVEIIDAILEQPEEEA